MLVKLRINDEQDWFDNCQPSEHSISCDKQFVLLLTELIESLEQDKIPTGLTSSYSTKFEGVNVFIFNGFDSKTNTYFFNYSGTVS